MSRHRSPLLSWVTLLLCLSTLTHQGSGFWCPALSQYERRGRNSSDHSQGVLLSDIESKQEDGSSRASIALNNQRAASERANSKRAASERADSERAASERADSERADSERAASERADSERAATKRADSDRGATKRADSERDDSERAARAKSNRAVSQRADSERATGERAKSESTDSQRAAILRAKSNRADSKRLAGERAISKRAVSDTVTSEKAASEVDAGPLCAYRILEDGKEGRLCFRPTQVNFTCPSGTCRQVRSPGGHLVANMLSNGSVLLQWTYKKQGGSRVPGTAGVPSEAPKLTVTSTAGGDGETLPAPPKSPSRGQQKQQGGFRMSCWWNGSYTQFECTSIVLGSSCRDFLLTELHENVPYRICLQPLWAIWDGAKKEKLPAHKMKTPVEAWDGAGCVDFSVSPSGMQDIVIAMTTVGGAICVMLVIICLLVAYITENIMSPSVQHTLTARHSTRSHNTHL